MKRATWVILTLALITGWTALVLAYGALGVVVGILGAIVFFVGLDRFYRWRSRILAQSMKPGETLVANGLVSEGTYDEVAAVLVADGGGQHRLLVADSRGAEVVLSITRELTQSSNPYDKKSYIELHTALGKIHFAPRKSLLLSGQAEYAQGVLRALLSKELPPSG